MTRFALSDLRYRDFVLFLGDVRDRVRDRDVVRRDRVAGLRGPRRPARPRARRSRDVRPAAAARAAGRAPGRPVSPPDAARVATRARCAVAAGSLRSRASGPTRRLAVLRARVRDGRRIGARRAGGPRPDAVARSREILVAGAGAAVGRLPDLGDLGPALGGLLFAVTARTRLRRRHRSWRPSRSVR